MSNEPNVPDELSEHGERMMRKYSEQMNDSPLQKEEAKPDEFTKGYNKAIDDVLMVMQINGFYVDKKIMKGYSEAIRGKFHEINQMRKPPLK